MTSKFLRRTAIAVSLSAFALTGVANADQNYTSPSRWNNFRPALDEALAAEEAADELLDAASDELPAPELTLPRSESIQQGKLDRDAVQDRLMPSGSFQPGNQAAHQNQAMGPIVTDQPHYSGGYPPASFGAQQQFSSTPVQPGVSGGNYSTMPSPTVGSGSDCNSCGSGAAPVSPYAHAMSSPWGGGSSCGDVGCGDGRPELFPWFGGANILLFNLEEGQGRRIATGLSQDFYTSDLDPDMSVGYDVSMGRYFGCGRYGLGMRFFQWNPEKESITRYGTAGTFRAAQPQYRDAYLNFGSGAESVYDHIDGNSTDSDGAYYVRMTRDLNFYGLELNLFQFGLMGAQRAAYAGCGPARHGLGAGLGLGHGRGFGGAAGPLVRSNSGRLRVTNSHGIRYLRISDETNVAYGIELNAAATNPAGPTRVTIFDDLDTENEMLGYQFGSTLTYCLGSRFDLNIGGKFGIYGNRATMVSRLGTDTQVAYNNGNTFDISTESSDTVLSTLGELDFGLGCRVTRGWTVRGGYRLMGVTGVANAVDSRTVAYSSLADLGQVHADDSYLLHGGYIGAEFNW